MTTQTTMDRGRMATACRQAANLYDTLAGDRITRGTAAALRAAAEEIDATRPAAPASVDPSEDLVLVVSALIALRDRAATGGWLIDDETMARLERAHAPHRAAALAKARGKKDDKKGRSRDD